MDPNAQPKPAPETERILCIYHGNCADGFTAAWAVYRALGDQVEFYPGVYQTPPPDVTGRHVLMVDFSYKSEVIRAMSDRAKTITIIDHHESAEKDLTAWIAPDEDMKIGFEEFRARCEFLGVRAIRAEFDMKRSGAMMAWNYFHPNTPAPMLVETVQDRDLWRFDDEPYKTIRPYTRVIQANIFSFDYDFTTWDFMASLLETEEGIKAFATEGEAIERKHFKDIHELLAKTTVMMEIGNYQVPCANLPYTMASDAANYLAEGHPFAACYWDTQEGRVFSLRSRKGNGMNVQEIARQYGGGGHRHAAGFTIKWEQFQKGYKREVVSQVFKEKAKEYADKH